MRDVYLPPDHFSPENQRRRGLLGLQARWQMEADEMDYTQIMEGRRIFIPRVSPAILRWQDGQEQRDLQLPFPKNLLPAAQERREQTRILRFLEDGIGLDDDTGAAVIHQGLRTIINLVQLRGLPHRVHLMRLWIQERLQLGDANAANQQINTFENIPIAQRRPPLTVTHGANFGQQFLQGLFPGDALALFQDFLDEQYPQGALVNLATPENQDYFVGSQPLQRHFAEFLDQHHDHPHHDSWQRWSENIRTNGKQYWPNIELLRPGSESFPPLKQRIPGVGVRQAKIIQIAEIPEHPIPRLG